jgi:hypothetical protein
MEMKTSGIEKIESGLFDFIINIEMKDVWILVESATFRGTRYTYISVRDKNCIPQMRIIVPAWVWRQIKEMIKNGDVHRIDNFILQVFKSFITINVSNKALDENYEKLYFEEPWRLLSLM